MSWIYLFYAVIVILLVLGISLVKDNNLRPWSLTKRVYLRNEFTNSINKYKRWYVFTQINEESTFGTIIKIIKKNRTQKMDREIFEAISFLRNMAAIGEGKKTSTDYMLQKLAEHIGLLQPIYIKMLSLLRLNKNEEAIAFFSLKVGTSVSNDFARLLIQWDQINPSELSEILLSHEKNMKEIRITNQKRRDELVSDLIYFPVVINVLIIFVNFIYVAYFIEQREMLQMLSP